MLLRTLLGVVESLAKALATNGPVPKAVTSTLLLYLVGVRVVRYRRRDALKKLNLYTTTTDSKAATVNIENVHKIFYTVSFLEFPFLSNLGITFGILRSNAIPSISNILSKTGELGSGDVVVQGSRRFDDTDLLLREFMENSLSTERAKLALMRTNALHSHYKIQNRDYLYVLSEFIGGPIRWIEKYGYRKLEPFEKEAIYLYWREIGIGMNLKNIPATYEEMKAYNAAFEEKHMLPAASNAKVVEGAMSLFVSSVPPSLRGAVKHVMYSMCDERLRLALGFPNPHYGIKVFMESILKMVGYVTRFVLPPRIITAARTTDKVSVDGKRSCAYHSFHPTYKDGYVIQNLGPKKYEGDGKLVELSCVSHEKSIAPSGCPFHLLSKNY
ncbi:hypothetical protein HDV05_006186 [Chytridiales sp. JEL 0842]|nr:hypothetical protein HDV05_006186 [Chytridiales sp. JEL 0842]